MFHAKFEDHQTSGSGVDLYMFLPYKGMAIILDHVTWTICQIPMEAPDLTLL